MARAVTIVDYGVGNLKSVSRALEHVGASVAVTGDARAIAGAERLLLPGVGAFGHCMQELRSRGLLEALHAYHATERPFFGICVGMQLLMQKGEEFGNHDGLGIIEGTVVKMQVPAPEAGKRITLPAIGWMKTRTTQAGARHPLFGALQDGAAYYYVHSYAVRPVDPNCILAHYQYHGVAVPAAIAKAQVVGLQFHPEKSGAAGLALLENMIAR